MCIDLRQGSRGMYRWAFDKRRRSLSVAVDGPLIVEDAETQVQAALDGVGMVWTLERYAAPFLSTGRLVRVLESWCPPFPIFLYYPRRRLQPPPPTSVVETLRQREGEGLRAGGRHARLAARNAHRRTRIARGCLLPPWAGSIVLAEARYRGPGEPPLTGETTTESSLKSKRMSGIRYLWANGFRPLPRCSTWPPHCICHHERRGVAVRFIRTRECPTTCSHTTPEWPRGRPMTAHSEPMHRLWTVNTTRVLGCAVLACYLAEPSDEPPTVVSLCTLAERADDFNGKLVRVEGRIVLGPEAFLLHEEGCDSLSWLTRAGASPSHTSVSEAPAEPGDQVAVGSRGMDFVDALRRDEVRSYLDSQTWAPVPAMAEIEPSRDDTWERFVATVRRNGNRSLVWTASGACATQSTPRWKDGSSTSFPDR